MFQHFVDSGVYNATFWFVLAGAAAVLLRWRPSGHRRLLILAAVLLVIGTGANLFLSLYRGYSVPRDVLQDIVSAQEFLAGRPLYPDEMTEKINEALLRDGSRSSLLERWPVLRQREENQRNEMLTSHWVQAHPPFMTLLTAPFVHYFGILGTQIAFLVVALAFLAITLALIRIELFPLAPRLAAAMVFVAVLGSDSVLTVLRSGQTGLMLGGFLTISWFLLRRGRPAWAGISAGLAISLKVVPGLILVVLLVRHRRAFVSALLTVASIGLLGLGLTSIQDHVDYIRTSRGVVEMYAAYSGNLSMLGTISRGLRNLAVPFAVSRALWLMCGGLLVLAFAWQIRSRPAPGREKESIDLQYALAMTLMPLLSPVAWDHYLVYLILPFSVLASQLARTNDRRLLGAFVGLLLFFAVPDSCFHWLFALCNAADLHSLGVWFVLDLRMAGVGILAAWLARRLGPACQWSPQTAAAAVGRKLGKNESRAPELQTERA